MLVYQDKEYLQYKQEIYVDEQNHCLCVGVPDLPSANHLQNNIIL